MRAFWRQVPLLFGLLLAPSWSAAETWLDVRLDAPDGLVGEPRRLIVELRTSAWFHKVQPLPAIRVDGAVVLMPGGFASNFTERHDGATFAVQQREVLLIPERSGTLTVPPLKLEAWVAGEAGAPQAVTLQSDPLALQIREVPGLAPGQRVPVATRLTLGERYSDERTTLRAGDGLTRQVRVEVEGVPGMFIVPLVSPALPGVRGYRDRALVTDRENRGQLAGERRETLTYLFETPGEVVLPELRVPWWNLSEQRMETAVLPARTLQIRPAVDALERDAVSLGQAATAAALSLCGLTAWLIRLWRRSGGRRETPERRAFRRLQLAMRDGTSCERLSALYAWLDTTGESPGRLGRLSCLDPALGERLNRLLRHLFDRQAGRSDGPPGGFGADDGRQLRRLRKRITGSTGCETKPPLAPLNPIDRAISNSDDDSRAPDKNNNKEP